MVQQRGSGKKKKNKRKIKEKNLKKGRELYFVVMENTFCAPFEITERYDLKVKNFFLEEQEKN